MKNFPKAGLLIVTLVIPALIFVLLKLFATNHYVLPYFLPERDAQGEIRMQNGDTLFHKVSGDCAAFDSAGFAGSTTVIHYLPTECDDSCKLGISEIERIAGLRSDVADLQILTVTEADAKPAGLLPADIGNWKVAHGTSQQVGGCYLNELGMNLDTAGRYPGLVLIDEASHIRGYYKIGNRQETDRLMAEIKILDYEKKNK
ncbi:hypothetical protein [Dyadobacter sp. MSC1_007]|jgi:protein SCO1/2|uniref:hypothetical protein n=1 Tax=Dyadobacter sp. MSC1_007 TaxID=2909264 RepID=UPI00202E036A|nr:hypothetical protein [Dyadobacter sp. MSC1_007]